MNSKEKQATVVSEGNSKHPHRNRHTVRKLMIGLSLAIAPLLYAVEIMSGASKDAGTAEERDKMFAAKTQSEQNHAIPPVDAHIPVRIETATFALG